MTFVFTVIAAISWSRFLYIGFTTRGGLTESSVIVPLLWTVLAFIA